MSSMSRAFAIGGLVGVLATLALAAGVRAELPREQAPLLRKGANAAIYGPELKLKIGDHDLTVKKATITKRNGGVLIRGQISHHLSLRSDDQLYYLIEKADGKVVSVKLSIMRGGVTSILSSFAGNIVGSKHAASAIDGTLGKLAEATDGKWDSKAKLLVASIALRAPDNLDDLEHPKAYQPKASK